MLPNEKRVWGKREKGKVGWNGRGADSKIKNKKREGTIDGKGGDSPRKGGQ